MTTLTRRAPEAPPLRTANLHRLEDLAGALASHGLHADVQAPPGRMPRLQVAAPAASDAEDVYAWRCQDGNWWYWWPWAERIATADDLDAAVERISHTLAPVSRS